MMKMKRRGWNFCTSGCGSFECWAEWHFLVFLPQSCMELYPPLHTGTNQAQGLVYAPQISSGWLAWYIPQGLVVFCWLRSANRQEISSCFQGFCRVNACFCGLSWIYLVPVVPGGHPGQLFGFRSPWPVEDVIYFLLISLFFIVAFKIIIFNFGNLENLNSNLNHFQQLLFYTFVPLMSFIIQYSVRNYEAQ